jgi:hypothetical protein
MVVFGFLSRKQVPMTDPRGEFNLANGRFEFEGEDMNDAPQTSKHPADCTCARAGFPGSCDNCDSDSPQIKHWRERALLAESVLEIAVNQWGMYADMHEREDERVRLVDEKSPEGQMYRHCRKVLSAVVGSPLTPEAKS